MRQWQTLPSPPAKFQSADTMWIDKKKAEGHVSEVYNPPGGKKVFL
jgi:hypothetical protein